MGRDASGTHMNDSSGDWVGSILQSMPAAYTIWKDGTTIKAEANIHGGTDYSGTDAATVIQAAHDALTNGGVIFIRRGEYTITSTINISNNNISLIGEGAKRLGNGVQEGVTLLVRDSALDNYVIKCDPAAGASYQLGNTIIAHMGLWGAKPNSTYNANQDAIYLEEFVKPIIFDVDIHNFAGSALRLEKGVMGGGNCCSIIEANAIENCNGYGIFVAGDYHHIYHNHIEDNAYSGIFITTVGVKNKIIGNAILATSSKGVECSGSLNRIAENYCEAITGSSIFVEGSLASKNIIANNTINGQTTGDAWAGIYIGTDANNNIIHGNHCMNGTADGIELYGSNYNTVTDNILLTNGAYGIMIDANANQNQLRQNYTQGNTTACVRVNNANCDNNVLSNNFFDEGDISNAGTNTRAWLNYDPSANAFITTINPPAVVGGGGGNLP